jgi:hypothetical protein
MGREFKLFPRGREVSVYDVRLSENFRQFWHDREKRRLVEECRTVTVSDLRAQFGRPALLHAIRECEPVMAWVAYCSSMSVYVTSEMHRLPTKREKWSNTGAGNARIWLTCPKCQRRAIKLFYFETEGPERISELLCRKCHDLTYVSRNCGGNKFYTRVIKPLRQLKRIEKQLAWHALPGPRRRALEAEKTQLEGYLLRAKVEFGRKSQPADTRQPFNGGFGVRNRKRPYKDLSLAARP